MDFLKKTEKGMDEGTRMVLIIVKREVDWNF